MEHDLPERVVCRRADRPPHAPRRDPDHRRRVVSKTRSGTRTESATLRNLTPLVSACHHSSVQIYALSRERQHRQPVRPSTLPPRAASARALGPAERQAVLDVLHSQRFVDQSPAEVQATLLEEQTYLCSTRTMYRILDAAQEVRERRDQARHPVYARPELVATAPN